jgi:selenocysteine-specific elongation factor
MPVSEVSPLVEELLAAGRLVALEAGLLHAHALQAAAHQVLTTLSAYHEANPMRSGMSREELRSRLSRTMDAKGFGRVLARMETSGAVVSEGGRIRSARHETRFTPDQENARETILRGLLAERFNPPSAEEIQTGLPPKIAGEVWDALVENGAIVRISAGVFLHQDAIAEAVERVRAYLTENGAMTASQFRDLLGTTRKYAVPLLEYLDAQRITRRRDDLRELF